MQSRSAFATRLVYSHGWFFLAELSSNSLLTFYFLNDLTLFFAPYCLWQKLVFPSDTRKKNVMNCGIVFQHLKQAGVTFYDEDGTVIVGEDIVNGDKELTLSLLWNIFVHLQASP